MDWLVCVGAHKYWVQADTKEDAEARGWRLHQASDNAKHEPTARVTESKQIDG